MFLWIVVVGGVFSFVTSMGIGSNDAANAFATSVGSKTLSYKQAVILGSVFETSGALFMGSHVTDTIRKDIANYECFEDSPYVFMYGCMWVIFSVGIWLFLASYWEMPVSTTHSCVGGMIGMSIALGGTHCVSWFTLRDTFPYIGGVGGIILSWVISPIVSGTLAAGVYNGLRIGVLRHPFSSPRLHFILPSIVGITLVINTFFIIYKGSLYNTPFVLSAMVSMGVGSIGGALTYPLVTKLKGSTPREMTIIGESEQFDPRTEYIFKYLQVFTAICDAFSHGANDVANSIGPFSVIYSVYTHNELSKDTQVDGYWILALGGVGIAMGLLLYGHKITRVLGEELCMITPSRGVAIELSSAIVVLTGSRLSIPLSTTHCQVGATVGVGLWDKTRRVNCKVVARTIVGWLLTCVVVGTIGGRVLVSQGIYSP